MAEGLVNHFYGDKFQAFSAGTVQTQVHPLAIKVMAELGIDISHHISKLVDVFLSQRFDMVVTVCDNARETCPYFPNATERIHISLEDPSQVSGSDKDKLQKYREVRDTIKDWLATTLTQEVKIP